MMFQWINIWNHFIFKACSVYSFLCWVLTTVDFKFLSTCIWFIHVPPWFRRTKRSINKIVPQKKDIQYYSLIQQNRHFNSNIHVKALQYLDRILPWLCLLKNDAMTFTMLLQLVKWNRTLRMAGKAQTYTSVLRNNVFSLAWNFIVFSLVLRFVDYKSLGIWTSGAYIFIDI